MSIEKPVKTQSRVFRTILWSLLAIVAALVLIAVFIEVKWKPFVKKQLQEAVSKGSDSLYRINFSGLNVNLFTGHVKVTNFELIPDLKVYNQLVAQKKAPNTLFHLSVKELNVLALAATKAYFQKKLIIDSVQIYQPDVTMISKRRSYNDTAKKEKPKTFYQLTKKVFQQVQVTGIVLKNINFVYINKNGKQPKQTALRHLDIRVNNLLVDSLSAQDTSRFYSSKSVDFEIDDYKMATADSLYFLKLQKLNFSTDKRQLLIKGLALVPRYSKTAFYQKTGVRQDRYDLKFDTISIDHLDLQRFNDQQKIYSTSASISNANVNIYTNAAYPKDQSKQPKRNNFPQQQLQQLATELKIDTLNLKNINISYAETNPDSKQTGTVTFNHTNGQFLNITNDTVAKKNNPYMTAKLHTHFLNAASLDVNFKFDLNDKKGAFSYNASLGKISSDAINKVTVPLALIKLKTVEIQHVDFKVDANNYSSAGQMKMRYKNLQVEILKNANGGKKMKSKGLISTLANTFVIDSDNPENGNFRIGKIQYNRPINISFFGLIWKSILSGIKSSVGIGPTKNK